MLQKEIEVEIKPCGWLSVHKKKQSASLASFNLSGISLLSTSKLKANQKVLVDLKCAHHCLHGIPMQVLLCDEQQLGFKYNLKFSLDSHPQAARQAALSVLNAIEQHLGGHAQ